MAKKQMTLKQVNRALADILKILDRLDKILDSIDVDKPEYSGPMDGPKVLITKEHYT